MDALYRLFQHFIPKHAHPDLAMCRNSPFFFHNQFWPNGIVVTPICAADVPPNALLSVKRVWVVCGASLHNSNVLYGSQVPPPSCPRTVLSRNQETGQPGRPLRCRALAMPITLRCHIPIMASLLRGNISAQDNVSGLPSTTLIFRPHMRVSWLFRFCPPPDPPQPFATFVATSTPLPSRRPISRRFRRFVGGLGMRHQNRGNGFKTCLACGT